MGFIIGGFHNVMFHNFAIFFSPLNLDLDFQNSLPSQSHPKIVIPEFQCDSFKKRHNQHQRKILYLRNTFINITKLTHI